MKTEFTKPSGLVYVFPAIEYTRPNRLRQDVPFYLPISVEEHVKFNEIENLWKKLYIELTLENIGSNFINVCVDSVDWGDYEPRLWKNDDDLPLKVKELIISFDREKYDVWLKWMKK